MIKINLIQKGASQKKAIMNVAAEIIIFSVIIILAIIVLITTNTMQNSRIDDVNTRIQRAREEQNRLRAVIEKVNELRRAAEVFERKVNIIQELKDQQQGPAMLMRALSQARPDNMQLTSIREQRGNIRLNGRATNEFAAASFVRDLKGTELFADVEIRTQRMTTLRGTDRNVFEFEIVCRLK